MNEEILVTAAQLERRGILRRGTVFRMARLGLIPAYRVGVKGRGLRFSIPEVLAALSSRCALKPQVEETHKNIDEAAGEGGTRNNTAGGVGALTAVRKGTTGDMTVQNSDTRIKNALAYAQRGWHVHPVAGKVPMLRDWPAIATTDPKTIEAWWGAGQSANVGIATGTSSGLLVLDVDADKGGEDALRTLEQQHGALPCTNSFKLLTEFPNPLSLASVRFNTEVCPSPP